MFQTTTRQNDALLHELLYGATTRVGPTGDVEYVGETKKVWFRVPFYHRDRDAIHDALKTIAHRRPEALAEIAVKVLEAPGLAKLSDLLIADADVIAPIVLKYLADAKTPGMDAGV